MNDDKIHFDIETLVDGDPSITVYKPRCVGCSEHNMIVVGIDKAMLGSDKTVAMICELAPNAPILIIDDSYDMVEKLATSLEKLVLTKPEYDLPLPKTKKGWKRNKKYYFGKEAD